jgi:hypothetical protein
VRVVPGSQGPLSQFAESVQAPDFDVGPHAITPNTKQMISVRIVNAELLNAEFSAIYET